MKFAKMTILVSTFSMATFILFTSLHLSNDHVPTLVLNISLAMAFFAILVMHALVKAQRRQLALLEKPFRLGAIAFALAGAAAVLRSMSLGLSTGEWEHWAMMLNVLTFVVSVILLWHNTFIERLLQDVKQK
ncbi:hypothetical protein JXA02_06915 [candidate division KSB1 bacterium]|nr:hypothetical protein [candidate division KSB1 bacterium]RQW06782.1 MAG: hypothetical protein EH222_08070 [candidate division KSB1 bacterium]